MFLLRGIARWVKIAHFTKIQLSQELAQQTFLVPELPKTRNYYAFLHFFGGNIRKKKKTTPQNSVWFLDKQKVGRL